MNKLQENLSESLETIINFYKDANVEMKLRKVLSNLEIIKAGQFDDFFRALENCRQVYIKQSIKIMMRQKLEENVVRRVLKNK